MTHPAVHEKLLSDSTKLLCGIVIGLIIGGMVVLFLVPSHPSASERLEILAELEKIRDNADNPNVRGFIERKLAFYAKVKLFDDSTLAAARNDVEIFKDISTPR